MLFPGNVTLGVAKGEPINRPAIIAAMIALATACAPAWAQDFKRVAPQQPPPPPPAKVVPPPERGPGANEHHLLGVRAQNDCGAPVSGSSAFDCVNESA